MNELAELRHLMENHSLPQDFRQELRYQISRITNTRARLEKLFQQGRVIVVLSPIIVAVACLYLIF